MRKMRTAYMTFFWNYVSTDSLLFVGGKQNIDGSIVISGVFCSSAVFEPIKKPSRNFLGNLMQVNRSLFLKYYLFCLFFVR